MKVFFVTLIVLGFVFQNQVVKAQSTNKDVVGTWNYEAPDAPEGFTEGTMVISEKAGALSGVLKLVDGEEMEFGSVEYSEGTLLVTLLVDYNTVSVNCTVKGTSMTGTVDTPDGSLTLTGKKVKTKKSKK
jgi:hypothetical protein